jgi:hypothetical protein
MKSKITSEMPTTPENSTIKSLYGWLNIPDAQIEEITANTVATTAAIPVFFSMKYDEYSVN